MVATVLSGRWKPKSREIKIKIDDPIQPGDTIVVKSKLF